MRLRHKTIDRYTFGTVYTIYDKTHNHGNSLVQSLAEPPEEGSGPSCSMCSHIDSACQPLLCLIVPVEYKVRSYSELCQS